MHYQSLAAISQLIRLGDVAITEVLAQQLQRVKELDPVLNSYVYLDEEGSHEQAAVLEQELAEGTWRGPLHGVPIAIKDLYGIEGQPFEIGMPSRSGKVAPTTATVVSRLQEAGAIIIGRLNLTEGIYAEHIPPFKAPRNPWDLDRWCGSSSSGSGVATAVGLAYGTLASDTGGSIRIPASCNGVTGLKPSWGRVSRYGAFPLAPTLDHPGPMARTALDTGIMLEAMAGADVFDPTASLTPVDRYGSPGRHDLTGWRIGIDMDWALGDVTEATATALREAISVYRELGAQIVPIRFPETETIIEDWFKVCGVQTAHAHAQWFEDHSDEYGTALRGLIELGRSVTGDEYQELILRRLEFTGEAVATLAGVDAMLLPGLPFEAPLAADMVEMDEKKVSDIHRYTVPFTMSQLPTLTMPGGFDTDPRLPVSIQLATGMFRERDLVTLGDAFQSATDWHLKHPEVQVE